MGFVRIASQSAAGRPHPTLSATYTKTNNDLQGRFFIGGKRVSTRKVRRRMDLIRFASQSAVGRPYPTFSAIHMI